MYRYRIVGIFVVMLVGLWGVATTALHAATETSPPCGAFFEKGQLDMSCWDGQSLLSLEGRWLLSYQAAGTDAAFDGVVQVPNRWREMGDGAGLPDDGRAQYDLPLLFPEELHGLGLRLEPVGTARRVSLIDQAGFERILHDTGGTELNGIEDPPFRPELIHFPDLKGQYTLRIVIRNIDGRDGGMHVAPVLGRYAQLFYEKQREKVLGAMLSSLLLGFAFLNFALWIGRGRGAAELLLALTALITGARLLDTSEVIYDLFPDMTARMDDYFGWMTFFLGSIFGAGFIQRMFPRAIPVWIFWLVALVMLTGVAILLTGKILWVHYYGDFARPAIAVLGLAVIFCLWRNWLSLGDLEEDRYGIGLTLTSILAIILAVIGDVIHYEVAGTSLPISLTALGMIFFVGAASLSVSKRYWKSLAQTARMAKELRVLNAGLEDIVAQRTGELREKNRQLQEMAMSDELTGLPNRRAFDQACVRELERISRSASSFVLGLADLDYFKQVNDRFGHEVGDEVLRRFAGLLDKECRAGDMPARWGGEEFCFLLPDTTLEAARSLSERLRQAFEQTDLSDIDPELSPTVSIGLAEVNKGGSISEALNRADEALYQSKGGGRNRVTVA